MITSITQPCDSQKINVIYFDTQYELAMSMIRIHLFDDEVTSNTYTVEDCIDQYTQHHGKYTYFEDWCGFCVHSRVLKKFYQMFTPKKRTIREQELLDRLRIHRIYQKHEFSLILLNEESPRDEVKVIYDHEFAHIIYSIDEDYAAAMNNITNSMPAAMKDSVRKILIKNGYSDDSMIIDDEIQAYLATSDSKYLKSEFNIQADNKHIMTYRDEYKYWRENVYKHV